MISLGLEWSVYSIHSLLRVGHDEFLLAGQQVAWPTRVCGVIKGRSILFLATVTERSQIPTLVAYRQGQYKASGAEALDYIDESPYTVAKWFKVSFTISNKMALTLFSFSSCTYIHRL